MKVIPKGWLKYQAMGEQVAGTKIVPFKVPLMEDACHRRMPDEEWFTPSILLQKQPGLKVVIDLTDTTRYYDPQEFVRQGVVHVKIRITGGGTLPPLTKLRKFFQTVDDFMKKFANDPDALVGVHCTHGLNRTGYFICHYMVDRLDMSPDDAIARFEAARGHNMHRVNFIDEIRNSKGKVTFKRESAGVDPKRDMQYSSPLDDPLENYISERPGRGSYNRSRRSYEDWRKRDDDSSSSNFQSFNRRGPSDTTKSHKYGDRKRHNREKRSSKVDKPISSSSCHRDTASGNSSGNWRE